MKATWALPESDGVEIRVKFESEKGMCFGFCWPSLVNLQQCQKTENE
jgi:hypothetical protein